MKHPKEFSFYISKISLLLYQSGESWLEQQCWLAGGGLSSASLLSFNTEGSIDCNSDSQILKSLCSMQLSFRGDKDSLLTTGDPCFHSHQPLQGFSQIMSAKWRTEIHNFTWKEEQGLISVVVEWLTHLREAFSKDTTFKFTAVHHYINCSVLSSAFSKL